jgi:superfamily I DNA and/or RNA helicase
MRFKNLNGRAARPTQTASNGHWHSESPTQTALPWAPETELQHRTTQNQRIQKENENENRMNIHEINLDLSEKLCSSYRYYLTKKYRPFIEKAVEYLKKQAHEIEVTNIEEISIISDENGMHSQTEKRVYRLHLKAPEDKQEEKVLEKLFDDHTTEIYEDKEFRPGTGIKVHRKNEEEKYIEIERKIAGKKIYLRPNTYQLDQQKKAINRLLHEPLSEHEPLLYLFGFSDEEYWEQDPEYVPLDWRVLTRDDIEGVDEQREFVMKALATKDFALMEGPPGSGKTTVIIELVAQLAKKGMRVLLCSATHAAIDNVIERVAEKYKDIVGDLIVPVRISGSEDSVKESVRPYLLSRLKKTYTEEILSFLRQNHTLESQKYLLENLSSKQGEQWIETLILESANLVAGTMIGILQHPAIKGNRNSVPFDVMIVDEASKVTFLDFIVPALYAKKWILVGDIKQLPPYIEQDYVGEYIQGFVDENEQKAILERYELKRRLSAVRRELIIYFTRRNVSQELETLQRELKEIISRDEKEHDKGLREFLNRPPHILTLDKKNLSTWTSEEIMKLNAADLLICEESKEVRAFIERHIFVKSVVINPEDSCFGNYSDFTYRQRYLYERDLHKRAYKEDEFYQFAPEGESWAEKVVNNLTQYFGFRDVVDIFKESYLDLIRLLPGKLWEEVNDIKRLVFPSILEILQRGMGPEKKQRDKQLITHGLSEEHKESRFVSLSYQHRMHPEIAEIPGKYFYGGKNLHSGTSVERRHWADPWGGNRVLWIPNTDATGNQKGGKIINPTEVDDMEAQLKKFLEWAEDNPKRDGGRYELAILSFYLHQVNELRKMVRRVTGQPNRYAKFQKGNVDIFLYTVDKFQGQEADVVFLGFTKFTRNAHYNSPNRLNVALTRARHKLLLFGNQTWFEKNAKLEALRELAKKPRILKY